MMNVDTLAYLKAMNITYKDGIKEGKKELWKQLNEKCIIETHRGFVGLRLYCPDCREQLYKELL